MLLMHMKPQPTVPERAWTTLTHSLESALNVVDTIVMWPFRVAESRRILETLAAMSDHDLQDIGVTRYDLRDSLALPANYDVGTFLADRRATHRRQG
jgi:uncharacterized protein YjiS (DUF1127 family)